MAEQENDGITLQMIFDHMRGMEQRLRREFRDALSGVKSEMNEMNRRFNSLEGKVDLLFVQMGNIDERLDDIEVVQLPAIKQAVGMT